MVIPNALVIFASMIKIERKKMPTVKRGRPAKYDFASMKVGDSFFALVKAGTLDSCARNFCKKKPNWSFRAVNEKDGARIWRIK